MRKLFLLVFLLKLSSLSAQNWQWAKGGGGNNVDIGQGITVLNSGETYVTGSYSSIASFGTFNLNGNTGSFSNIFVAKYSASGNVIWAKQAGTPNANDVGYGVCADDSDNCIVTGYFHDTAFFNTDTLISSGQQDIFVAKYDSSGNEIWVKQAGGSQYNDVGFGVSTDDSGNVFVTGYITGIATFGTITLIGSANDIFIAKYDRNGTILWAKNAGSGTDDQGRGIKADKNGNSFVTGYFQGTSNFDLNSVTSSGGIDGFIAQYDANGNNVWVKKIGGVNADVCSSIAIDTWNNSYLCGTSNGSAFNAKYNSIGNSSWFHQTAGNNIAYGIACDTTGNFIYTGSMTSSSTIGSFTLNPISLQDIFVVGCDSAGNTNWAFNTGGNSSNGGYAVATDDDCNGYVTGSFDNTVNFGTHLIVGSVADVFVAKENGCPTGIKNLNNEIHVNIFPDPATDEINFRFDKEMKGSILIFDITGQKLMEKKFSQPEYSVDVSTFFPGIYFAEIQTSNGNSFTKFVKK